MGRVSSQELIYDAPDYHSSPTASQGMHHASSSLRWAKHCCSWMATPICLALCIDPAWRLAQWVVRCVVGRVGTGEAASGARMWSRRGVASRSAGHPQSERRCSRMRAPASSAAGGRAPSARERAEDFLSMLGQRGRSLARRSRRARRPARRRPGS